MTPYELRIRCAEIEGWHVVTPWLGTKNDSQGIIPDYCNSIDAINAAVLRLSEEKQMLFCRRLLQIVGKEIHATSWKVDLAIATASALDRATAFASIHK